MSENEDGSPTFAFHGKLRFNCGGVRGLSQFQPVCGGFSQGVWRKSDALPQGLQTGLDHPPFHLFSKISEEGLALRILPVASSAVSKESKVTVRTDNRGKARWKTQTRSNTCSARR